MVEKIADVAEGLLSWLGRSVKQSMSDYVDIKTVEDEVTFVLSDGSRMTLLRVDGSRRMVGVTEFHDVDTRVAAAFAAYMRGGGHSFSMIFESDSESVGREIRATQAPMRETAERVGLDLTDLFDEDERVLSGVCSAERCWLALYTRPAAFGSADLKRDAAARKELFKDNPLPGLADAPNLFRVIAGLKSRHESFVAAVRAELSAGHIAVRVLEVHEAARDLRMSLDNGYTSDDWRASLPGDPIPVRVQRRSPDDVSGMLWPPLDRQIAPRDAVENAADPLIVELGDRVYKPQYVYLGQSGEQAVPFQVLFKRVRETRIPWRISFKVDGGGLDAMRFKGYYTALFAFTSPSNKLMRNAVERVEALVRDAGQYDVKLRIDFTTWAPKDDRRLLDARSSRLARALQGWGGCDVRELSGDPTEALVGTTACNVSSPATVACAVLADVTPQLPLYRPYSPWEAGAVLFRTPDGKLYPVQPSSSVQSNWINIVIAEPRAGKTLLVNAINLALCISPGQEDLPYIAIIDIGRGSSGLTSLLTDSLPVERRHKVLHYRMRMSRDHAINPFDTQLGCRHLLPHEEAFAVNFLTLLMTPPGDAAAPDGMPGLCQGVLQEAFRHYSDSGPDAKRYSPHSEGSEAVDEALERIGAHLDQTTTWWEVVDTLYAHGEVHAATLAQRNAVPTLPELMTLSRERQFADLYGAKSTPSGEPLLAAFGRMLSEAVRRYPILSRPTQFDIGEARVVSIDLDEVAKQGSAVADHQTNVCYMLARHVAARHFYLNEDHIASFPSAYRAYHGRRILEIRQQRKHLVYDEVHRTSGAAATRAQIELDAREGGKWGIMLTLISHRPKDFPPEVLAMASGRFVLSTSDGSSDDLLRDVWNATDTVLYAARHFIRPPSRANGSTMIAMFRTRDGDVSQLLNLQLGGIRLWAFSTSNEDSYVRDVLYRQIGGVATRQLLARLYPDGTILPEVERRKLALESSGAMVDAERRTSVIDEMVRELLAAHRQGEHA